MTLTSARLSEGPLFRVMVTGPVAPDQVMSKALPASMALKLLLVKATLALARPARMTDEMKNFILIDC